MSYDNTLSTAGERINYAHGTDIYGRRVSSIVARILAFLACIREVSGLNLGRDIHHSDEGYSWFSSVIRDKFRERTSNQATATSFRDLLNS